MDSDIWNQHYKNIMYDYVFECKKNYNHGDIDEPCECRKSYESFLKLNLLPKTIFECLFCTDSSKYYDYMQNDKKYVTITNKYNIIKLICDHGGKITNDLENYNIVKCIIMYHKLQYLNYFSDKTCAIEKQTFISTCINIPKINYDQWL